MSIDFDSSVMRIDAGDSRNDSVIQLRSNYLNRETHRFSPHIRINTPNPRKMGSIPYRAVLCGSAQIQ